MAALLVLGMCLGVSEPPAVNMVEDMRHARAENG